MLIFWNKLIKMNSINLATHNKSPISAQSIFSYMKKTKTGATELDYITAEGDLIVTTEQEVITARKLVYKAVPDTVYLYQDVKITREENQLSGQYGEVSRKTGISKILPVVPGQDKNKSGRIQALIIPKSSTRPVSKKEIK